MTSINEYLGGNVTIPNLSTLNTSNDTPAVLLIHPYTTSESISFGVSQSQKAANITHTWGNDNVTWSDSSLNLSTLGRMTISTGGVNRLTIADANTPQTFTNKTINSSSNTISITSGLVVSTNINDIVNQPLLTTSNPSFAGINLGNINISSVTPTISSSTSLILRTDNTDRLTIPQTGISTNNSATDVLVLSGNTLQTRQVSSLPASAPFDQSLNTTDSPTFVSISSNDTGGGNGCFLKKSGFNTSIWKSNRGQLIVSASAQEVHSETLVNNVANYINIELVCTNLGSGSAIRGSTVFEYSWLVGSEGGVSTSSTLYSDKRDLTTLGAWGNKLIISTTTTFPTFRVFITNNVGSIVNYSITVNIARYE